jgi:hypothetical protein
MMVFRHQALLKCLFSGDLVRLADCLRRFPDKVTSIWLLLIHLSERPENRLYLEKESSQLTLQA